MIQRGSGIAVWWQIVQTLEKDIADEAYKPGGRLPSEAELAERFAVNRHTIRRAVAELEKRGLVRIEQGRGIFLQEYAVRYSVGKRTRFSENLRRQQLAGSMRVVGSENVTASGPIAKALGLRTGTALLKVDTVGEVDGMPINFSSHFFPAKRFVGIAEAVIETGSITQALHRYGIDDYERTESRITARLPDEATAQLLQQPRNQPVLQVDGVNVDREGKAVEYCISRFAGDAVQIVVNDE
ncbi:MAG: phosphonate metabolism transcriptional regulator PhnF [Sulfuritalea sp.]|nr:phosphonate metabolism transcriptional regulator PhnF [Sulfuritalea sp.]MDP1984020.1 phosphonate metabolism transcriptional regulator PhnF [Sulfuritalea sp.]